MNDFDTKPTEMEPAAAGEGTEDMAAREGSAQEGDAQEGGQAQEGEGTAAAREGQGSNEPGGEGAPGQTAQQNHYFAQKRREQEMFQRITAHMVNPATNRPFENLEEFDSWKQAARDQQLAQAAGLTAEDYDRVKQQAVADFKANDPEYLQNQQALQALQQQKMEQVFEKDLAEIKKAYPDEKAKHISELGEAFIAMMATNKVSAIAAYEAIRAEKARTQPAAPSMGDVKGAGQEQKDWYTKEEVEKMTPDEVHKNYDKITASYSKW